MNKVKAVAVWCVSQLPGSSLLDVCMCGGWILEEGENEEKLET